MTIAEMKKPSKGRRILSDLFDLFLALILFFCFFCFVFQPIFNNATDYKKVYNQYYSKLSSTGLYDYNKAAHTCNIIELKFEKGKKPTAEDYYNFYEYRLINYYTSEKKLTDYDEIRDNSKLFEIVDEKYVLIDGVSTEKAKSFYISSIKSTIDDVFMKNEENAKLASKVNNYNISLLLLSFVSSFGIIYLVLPLFFDGGQTVGKKLFNLKLFSTKDGFKVKKETIIIRELIVIFVGYLLSVFTFGISALAFLITYIFQKQNRSIDDFLASTIVYENVDLDGVETKDIINFKIGEKTENPKVTNDTEKKEEK